MRILLMLLSFLAYTSSSREYLIKIQDSIETKEIKVDIDLNEEINTKKTKSTFALDSSNINTKVNILEETLNNNEIDCPPKRMKLSKNTWFCSNGKKVIIDDKNLQMLMDILSER